MNPGSICQRAFVKRLHHCRLMRGSSKYETLKLVSDVSKSLRWSSCRRQVKSLFSRRRRLILVAGVVDRKIGCYSVPVQASKLVEQSS